MSSAPTLSAPDGPPVVRRCSTSARRSVSTLRTMPWTTSLASLRSHSSSPCWRGSALCPAVPCRCAPPRRLSGSRPRSAGHRRKPVSQDRGKLRGPSSHGRGCARGSVRRGYQRDRLPLFTAGRRGRGLPGVPGRQSQTDRPAVDRVHRDTTSSPGWGSGSPGHRCTGRRTSITDPPVPAIRTVSRSPRSKMSYAVAPTSSPSLLDGDRGNGASGPATGSGQAEVTARTGPGRCRCGRSRGCRSCPVRGGAH